MKRALVGAGALAFVVLFVLLIGRQRPAPEAEPVPEPPDRGTAADAPAAPAESISPALPAAPEAPPEPEPAPAGGAPVATLRREPKLAAEPLSEVEHELVGAWDDRGSAPELGAHRVLVAVVSPAASDAEIEKLLRDARARHRDAEILDVRVYDSGVAAAQAGWLGKRKLVGEVKRNDRLGYDALMVRGRALVP